MLKRFFIFLTMLTILIGQTQASTQTQLKELYDDLQISLMTEWDQKDQNFYNSQSEKFTTELRKLQAQGLTNVELANFALSQIKDKHVAREFQTAMTLVNLNQLSAEDAQKMVKKMMDQSASRGASWSGEVIGGAVVFLLLTAAVLVLVGQAKVDDGCYQTYRCEKECNLGICSDNCGYKCI